MMRDSSRIASPSSLCDEIKSSFRPDLHFLPDIFPPSPAAKTNPPRIRPTPNKRGRAARELVKQGQDGVPSLQRYVTDTDLGVRLEAVKALDDIGGPKTVDALVLAARDPDPEIQIRATDGLVNVYLPGYLKTGISGTLQRVGNSVKAKFTDTNDQGHRRVCGSASRSHRRAGTPGV